MNKYQKKIHQRVKDAIITLYGTAFEELDYNKMKRSMMESTRTLKRQGYSTFLDDIKNELEGKIIINEKY